MSGLLKSRVVAERPPSRSRRFQFRVATVLLLMIPCGIGSLWLRNYLRSRPIEWVPYSASTLHQYQREGRTVLLNFHAEWSLTILSNERYALDTPRVRRFVREHGIVAMRADFTEGSSDILAAMQSLHRRGLPLAAIYPSRDWQRPIILDDLLTEEQVLEALEKAVKAQ